MTEHDADSGLEVVLDNRKIILAFVVFIVICGGFFVLGFVEGKRQGYQAEAQMAAETATVGEAAATQAQLPGAGTVQDSKPPKDDSEDQPLNWYKSVNRRDEETETAPRAATGSSKQAAAETGRAIQSSNQPKAERPSLAAGPINYAVQVGAFIKQEEAEIRGRELRSKGYDYRIESPTPPDRYYLVKVGNYNTRAEAVAMQLRLKKSGFSCFVKTD